MFRFTLVCTFCLLVGVVAVSAQTRTDGAQIVTRPDANACTNASRSDLRRLSERLRDAPSRDFDRRVAAGLRTAGGNRAIATMLTCLMTRR